MVPIGLSTSKGRKILVDPQAAQTWNRSPEKTMSTFTR